MDIKLIIKMNYITVTLVTKYITSYNQISPILFRFLYTKYTSKNFM